MLLFASNEEVVDLGSVRFLGRNLRSKRVDLVKKVSLSLYLWSFTGRHLLEVEFLKAIKSIFLHGPK
jgi:hypothetical protein